MRVLLLILIILFSNEKYCLSQTNKQCCKNSFYEKLTEEYSPGGFYVCIPYKENGDINILIVNYPILENYYIQKTGHSKVYIKNYIINRLKKRDFTWGIKLKFVLGESILLNANIKRLDKKTKQNLSNYLLNKSFSIPFEGVEYRSQEWFLLVYKLFKNCILAYEDDESGGLRFWGLENLSSVENW